MAHYYDVWNHGIERKPTFTLANGEFRVMTGMVIPHYKWSEPQSEIERKPTFALANGEFRARISKVGRANK